MSVATLANTMVTVQRRSNSTDASGGVVQTWTAHLNLRARVQPLSAFESARFGSDTETITHKVYFPGVPDIKHSDRLQYTDRLGRLRTLEIRGVRNTDELDVFTTVEAEEQTAKQ